MRAGDIVVEVYAVNINEEIDHERYIKFLSSISEDKKERIKRFYFKADKLRVLYGDVLIRYLISKKKGIRNKDIQIVHNRYGKPYLATSSDFYFNISHSGDWVLCAIAESEVGIDIEQIKAIDFNIAKEFFSEQEYKDIMSKPASEQLNYFFDLWTLKESYVKQAGKGLSIPLNSFEITQKNKEFFMKKGSSKKVRFKQYNLDVNYKVSVCSEDCFAAELIISSLKEIDF